MVSVISSKNGFERRMAVGVRRLENPAVKRKVPAFTTQAYQKNTWVKNPKKCNLYEQRPLPPTAFRQYYNLRMLPIALDYNFHRLRIRWLVDIYQLDFEFYLPIFFEGLTEMTHPYELLVYQGIDQLIDCAGSAIVRCLPRLVFLMKAALRTRIPHVVINVCRVLRKLANSSPLVGIALVAHYGVLLSELRLYKDKNLNIGDGIDFGLPKGILLGDVIRQTIETFERTGGQGAFLQIKYLIPTYESIYYNY